MYDIPTMLLVWIFVVVVVVVAVEVSYLVVLVGCVVLIPQQVQPCRATDWPFQNTKKQQQPESSEKWKEKSWPDDAKVKVDFSPLE